jgi:hypothetical protein
LVALYSTRLKSSSIFFSLKMVFSRDLLLKLGVLFDSMEKFTLERYMLRMEGIKQCSEKNDQVYA